MILISHRGNLDGPIHSSENHPDYIDNALNLGYNVEIDVWVIDDIIFLGHDNLQYKIDIEWVFKRNDVLWVHCKNIDAIEFFNEKNIGINYFWHQKDDVTLTNKGFIWAYPGKQPIKKSIAVMPELFNDDLCECAGICSDYIIKYEKKILI